MFTGFDPTCGTCRHWNQDRAHPTFGLCMLYDLWERQKVDFERPVPSALFAVPLLTDSDVCSKWERAKPQMP